VAFVAFKVTRENPDAHRAHLHGVTHRVQSDTLQILTGLGVGIQFGFRYVAIKGNGH
jgi:hypothetical protein